MLGYIYDEFIRMSGEQLKGVIYPPDVAKAMKIAGNDLKKGTNIQGGIQNPKKDGTLLWVMDYGKKVRNANQVIINEVLSLLLISLKRSKRETIGRILEMEKRETK